MKPKLKMTQLEMQCATEGIIRELGVNIEAALKEYFPGSKFVLITFPAGNPKVNNYITNSEIETMIIAADTLVKKLTPKETGSNNPMAIH